MPAEVRTGAQAGPSNEGATTAVAARFGPPNQASTKAIQTCLQAGTPSMLCADASTCSCRSICTRAADLVTPSAMMYSTQCQACSGSLLNVFPMVLG